MPSSRPSVSKSRRSKPRNTKDRSSLWGKNLWLISPKVIFQNQLHFRMNHTFSQYQHLFQFYKRKFCSIKESLSRAISWSIPIRRRPPCFSVMTQSSPPEGLGRAQSKETSCYVSPQPKTGRLQGRQPKWSLIWGGGVLPYESNSSIAIHIKSFSIHEEPHILLLPLQFETSKTLSSR